MSGKVINDIKSSPLDSQIRKLGTREVKHLAKGHTTGKGQSQDSNLDQCSFKNHKNTTSQFQAHLELVSPLVLGHIE